VHELILDLHEGRPVLLQMDVVGRHLQHVAEVESGSDEDCSSALKGVSELRLCIRRDRAIRADADDAGAAKMIAVAYGGRVVPTLVKLLPAGRNDNVVGFHAHASSRSVETLYTGEYTFRVQPLAPNRSRRGTSCRTQW
jgi:hypothetical protein